MADLNKTPFDIVVRTGLSSSVFSIFRFWKEGQLGYTTDTKNLYIADNSRSPDGGNPQLVQQLKNAVIHNGHVLTHENEIVYI